MSTSAASDLETEATILQSMGSEPGFPRLRDWFLESSSQILVMSLLGQNLGSLHKSQSKFSLKTVILIALQCLRRIEALHRQGMVHRDIKPENLIMGDGQNDESTLYLIDFGLTVPYLNNMGIHMPFSKNGHVVGTLYYMSVFAHLGIQASRRDDLISLGYALVHLMKGSLPWVNVSAGEFQEKIRKIIHMKSTIC